jgi:hypothetical protein
LHFLDLHPRIIHNNVNNFLQDAFFGREILDGSKEQRLLTALDIDDDKTAPNVALPEIQLNQVNLFYFLINSILYLNLLFFEGGVASNG